MRDATKQDTQTAQGGILAFIREAAESLEKQLDGPNSPVARWSTLYRQARTEITTGLPAWREWPSLIRDFLIVTAIWAGLALGLRWITRRLARRREAASTPPSRSQPRQLLWMAAVQLAPWAIAFVITLYLSVAMPDSVGQLGALVLAYVLLAGALFSSLSLICLTLLDGPHRTRALDILHRRALPPLWLIGSLAALGDSLHDPEIMSVFGPGVRNSRPAGQRDGGAPERAVRAALSPPHHPPDPQPAARARRATRHGLQELLRLIGPLWFVPFLLLVGISLVSTVAAADDSGQVMRRALLCALVAIVGMAVGGVIRRAYARGGRDGNRRMAYRGSSGISATPCSTSPTCCCSWKSACACWACRWPA